VLTTPEWYEEESNKWLFEHLHCPWYASGRKRRSCLATHEEFASKEDTLGKVLAGFSMSLDDCIAQPNENREDEEKLRKRYLLCFP
jgi:hypothetical protein